MEGKTFFLFLCKVGDKTPLLLGLLSLCRRGVAGRGGAERTGQPAECVSLPACLRQAAAGRCSPIHRRQLDGRATCGSVCTWRASYDSNGVHSKGRDPFLDARIDSGTRALPLSFHRHSSYLDGVPGRGGSPFAPAACCCMPPECMYALFSISIAGETFLAKFSSLLLVSAIGGIVQIK